MNERVKLLEAVVAAAESLDVSISCGDKLLEWRHRKLKAALRAYRTFLALSAQPAGETVTLAVWEEGEEGYAALCKPNGPIDKARANFDGWRRLGTITLEVTP